MVPVIRKLNYAGLAIQARQAFVYAIVIHPSQMGQDGDEYRINCLNLTVQ